MIKKLILCCVAICFISMPAWSATIYVDTNETDCADYDPAASQGSRCGAGSSQMYDTVQEAVTNVTVGDTIQMRGGTYNECQIVISQTKNGTAWTAGNFTTLESYPGEWAVIDGQDSCSDSNYHPAVIVSNNSGGSSCKSGCNSVEYWKLERFEITGGGNSGGDYLVAGIAFVDGPVWLRYLYIHDNNADNGDAALPAGIRIHNAKDSIIEYCWIQNNGATSSNKSNGYNIEFQTDYHHQDSNAYNADNATRDNIIRYNIIEYETGDNTYGGAGFRHKDDYEFWDLVTTYPADLDDRFDDSTPSAWFTAHHDQGDQIHHNLFLNGSLMNHGEFTQIYNNILKDPLDGLSAVYEEDWGGAASPETYWNVVYNNTVIGGPTQISFGSGNNNDAKPYGYIYNNIMDANTAKSVQICYDMTADDQPTMTEMVIANNLIHDADDGDWAFQIGNISGVSDRYTVTTAEAAFGTIDDNSQDNTDNSDLFAGASGADQYITDNSGYGGGMNLSTGGIGGSHPYLSGVTLPSYVGATDPSDITANNWVNGLLNDLTSTTWLRSMSEDRDASDDPDWIADSESGAIGDQTTALTGGSQTITVGGSQTLSW